MSNPELIIEAAGVTRTYRVGTAELNVLRGVDEFSSWKFAETVAYEALYRYASAPQHRICTRDGAHSA